MSYKTILVQIDQAPQTEQRIKIAADIAIAQGAHLIGTTTSAIGRFSGIDATIGLDIAAASGQYEAARTAAISALHDFGAKAKSLGVPSFEQRASDDEAADSLSLQARYSDLVVVSQPDPDQFSAGGSDLPEYVMLNCARPVLIVPYAGHFAHVGKQVLIAWDGGNEATRAITAALPLLQHATKVSVAVFNGEKSSRHGEQPGADIALYLARHGVKVEVLQKDVDIDIGNALLSLATDIDADLIVMGGYSKSPLREKLLGGATLTVLRTMTVPVLMAH